MLSGAILGISFQLVLWEDLHLGTARTVVFEGDQLLSLFGLTWFR